MNLTNIKPMVIWKQEELNIALKETDIEQVTKYKYLRVEISADATQEESKRIGKTMNQYFHLYGKFINNK